ncbi:hypothetical protein PM082_020880 [Marasmius tenuissimus]|nr:hypothetical protein PM082_020880 [Marasmius tenuissimus]
MRIKTSNDGAKTNARFRTTLQDLKLQFSNAYHDKPDLTPAVFLPDNDNAVTECSMQYNDLIQTTLRRPTIVPELVIIHVQGAATYERRMESNCFIANPGTKGSP